MTNYRQSLGHWGEEQAALYLEQHGYQVLGRNIRTAYGEIDLLASQAGVFVFVEVKTRSSRTFGFPEDSITPKKMDHLVAAAQAYLQAHPEDDGDWRIDVISVERSGSAFSPHISHFENIQV